MLRLVLLHELAAKLHVGSFGDVFSQAQSAARWIFPNGRLTTIDVSALGVGNPATGPTSHAELGPCYVAYFPGPPEPMHIALASVGMVKPQEVGLAAMFCDLLIASLRTEGLTQELANQARTDWLTGLANRLALSRRLEQGLPVGHGIGMADINGLKAINDGQGHAAGDAFLRQVAHRLTEVAGPHGRVYRFGGDEFIVIASHDTLLTMEVLLHAEGQVSFGWAPAEDDPAGALSAADVAMYTARRQQRGQGSGR